MHLHDIILGLMLDRILQAKALGPVYVSSFRINVRNSANVGYFLESAALSSRYLYFTSKSPWASISSRLQLFSLKTALGPNNTSSFMQNSPWASYISHFQENSPWAIISRHLS